MPKISVIIPVYNVESYLSRCLNSVINQSFNDIEIICVNDGSKDNSLKILQEYKEKDNRIVIVNQENKGLSGARNSGLKIAKGKYIYFIDSDDWIKDTLLEKAYNLIIRDNSDIVLFDVINVYNNSMIPVNRAGDFVNRYKIYKLRFEDNNEIIYHTPTAWSKLYKRSFLEKYNLKFPEEVRFGEDSPFWIALLFKNPIISILDENLYFYMKRNSGLSGNYSKDFLEKQWDVYLNIITSKDYQLYSQEHKLLALDFECRLAVYGYSTINKFELLAPYEHSLCKFEKEFKNFKSFNLWKYKGYRLLRFRHLYTIAKKIVLLSLKLKNKRRL